MYKELSNTIQTITKVFHFCYAHHLENYNGKCARHHGHNVTLELSVRPPQIKPDEDNVPDGMILDTVDLKRVVRDIIFGQLVSDVSIDHNDLNEHPHFKYGDKKNAVPTTIENLAKFLWGEINKNPLIDGSLYKLKLWETPTIYTEIISTRK